jgi:hypothetical protein
MITDLMIEAGNPAWPKTGDTYPKDMSPTEASGGADKERE